MCQFVAPEDAPRSPFPKCFLCLPALVRRCVAFDSCVRPRVQRSDPERRILRGHVSRSCSCSRWWTRKSVGGKPPSHENLAARGRHTECRGQTEPSNNLAGIATGPRVNAGLGTSLAFHGLLLT